MKYTIIDLKNYSYIMGDNELFITTKDNLVLGLSYVKNHQSAIKLKNPVPKIIVIEPDGITKYYSVLTKEYTIYSDLEECLKSRKLIVFS